ncbi:MAG: GNAT family N-acetyltransferase [Anaerolineae bacterium]|nr:GNAT family N-acetyltransferase [Anaerolineae bacterium]
MEIIPATEFTLQELADAYNETRIDYIIPMPMTVERLRGYIDVYDIDLACSCAATRDDEILGIGMLGLRREHAWVTRLGVLPSGRRQGVGRAIMIFLLDAAYHRGLPETWLEVIDGNNPAHELFRSLGFVETRQLIVARRPPRFDEMLPGEVARRPHVQHVRTLDHDATLRLLDSRTDDPNWINQTESVRNARDVGSLVIETEDGGHGWVTYKTSLLRLTRIIVATTSGDPAQLTAALLQTLHDFYPTQDAIAENIPADDPRWHGFLQAGYFEAFRRIEMVKEMASWEPGAAG